MIYVHLYGKYKRQFGSVLKLNVSTFAAAIRMLEANFPGKFVKQVEKDSFYVARGRTLGRGKHINIEKPEMVQLNCPDQSHFHLIPAATGGASSMARRKGLGSILLGAVLLGASFFFPWLGVTGALAGLSLIAGGASLLLSPDVASKNEDKSKSYAFSGPLNVSNQGATKPLIYGKKVRVGSVMAGGSISSQNVGTNNNEFQLSDLITGD